MINYIRQMIARTGVWYKLHNFILPLKHVVCVGVYWRMVVVGDGVQGQGQWS